MRGRKNQKVRRDPMPEVASVPVINRTMLEEHGGIKLGDSVFFNISLAKPKYNSGRVKEIYVQHNGAIVFVIWDDDKGMWRHFGPDKVTLERPVRSRRDK